MAKTKEKTTVAENKDQKIEKKSTYYKKKK